MRELITSYNLYVRIAFVTKTFLNENTKKEGNSFVTRNYFPPILTIKHNLYCSKAVKIPSYSDQTPQHIL